MGIQTSIAISFGKGRGGWRVRGKEKFKKEQKWNESEALRNTTHEVLKGGSASAFSLFSFVIFFVRLNVEVEGGGGESRCYSISIASHRLASRYFPFFHLSNFSWS